DLERDVQLIYPVDPPPGRIHGEVKQPALGAMEDDRLVKRRRAAKNTNERSADGIHDEPGHDSFLGIYQIEPQEVFTLPRRTMPGSERVRAQCRTCQSESAQRLGMVRAAARRRRAAGRQKNARA